MFGVESRACAEGGRGRECGGSGRDTASTGTVARRELRAGAPPPYVTRSDSRAQSPLFVLSCRS